MPFSIQFVKCDVISIYYTIILENEFLNTLRHKAKIKKWIHH
jgi:hypothetical protein